MSPEKYFASANKIYGIKTERILGKRNCEGFEFDDLDTAYEWLRKYENFAVKELTSKYKAERYAGKTNIRKVEKNAANGI